MSLTIIDKTHLRALVEAARNIQNLMNDGTITAAFDTGNDEQIHTTVSAFDHLTTCAARVAAQDKIASPFIRYRREILANGESAGHLRSLVLALYCDAHVDLSTLLKSADPLHARITLECIASYSQYGENDTFHMSLAAELLEAIMTSAATIANGLIGEAA